MGSMTIMPSLGEALADTSGTCYASICTCSFGSARVLAVHHDHMITRRCTHYYTDPIFGIHVYANPTAASNYVQDPSQLAVIIVSGQAATPSLLIVHT